MSAKRKRPKVRYAVDEIKRDGASRWTVCSVLRQVPFDHLCECFHRAAAERIAAALNLHEAVKRGEM